MIISLVNGNNRITIIIILHWYKGTGSSLLSADGYCEKVIRSRIEMAKKILHDRKKLFTSKLNLELKNRIIKCLVWSLALCATKTWTLTKADRKRPEVFEMWIWRRMMKIRCMDKISNEKVLAQVNKTRTMLNSIWVRKHSLTYCSHIY